MPFARLPKTFRLYSRTSRLGGWAWDLSVVGECHQNASGYRATGEFPHEFITAGIQIRTQVAYDGLIAIFSAS